MILTRKEIEQLIGEAEVMIKASTTHPKIKAYLLGYKYDPPRLAVGENLLVESKAFYQKRIVEGGKQLVATSALEETIETAKPVYHEHLTIGRLILKHEPIKMAQFSMAGERKQDFHGWVMQAEAFYKSILADDDILLKYDEFGVTREKLENGLSLIEKVREANQAQETAKSTAQVSTEERNTVVFQLADWIHDLRVILKLALAPEPQLLEAAGIKAESK